MKQIYRVSLLIIAVLIVCGIEGGATEAEYRKLAKSWTLYPDGSQEQRVTMELKLFTHTAMNSTYGESFILYNPDFQELKIHESYTKQRDGNIVKTPENAFVEVLPKAAEKAPYYNRLCEMVVVHTGLELGATIVLDYSILTKPGYYAALDINEWVQESSPVKEYTLTLSIPENLPLNYQLLGYKGKPSKKKVDGMQRLTWKLRNLSATSREPFQPENRDETLRLIASTYGEAPAATTLLKRHFDQSMRMETEAFARYITEEAGGEAEKIEIIRRHVVDNLDYCPIPPEQTGFRMRSPDQVIRSAYGTAEEKVGLLYAMLRAVGIPADIVAVYPARLDLDACGLKAIKRLAVRAIVRGKEEYYSATEMTPSTIPARGFLDRVVTLDGRTISQMPLYTQVDVRRELTVEAQEGNEEYRVYSLPTIAEGLDGWGMKIVNSRRTTVFELPSLIKETITYIVTPEQGWELRTPATFKNIDLPVGRLHQSLLVRNGKIEVVRNIEIYKQQVSPAEYDDLRQLLNEWYEPSHRILLFHKQ